MSVHTDDEPVGAKGATTKNLNNASNGVTAKIDDASASAKGATAKIVDDASAAAKNVTSKIRELVEQYRLPGFDLDGFITSRQADIDALSKATSAVFAGAQSITEKQADLLKATLGELRDAAAQDTAETGNAGLREGVEKQTDLVQGVLARTLDSMKEMADAAQSAQMEVFNIAVERAQAGAADLRALFGIRKS